MGINIRKYQRRFVEISNKTKRCALIYLLNAKECCIFQHEGEDRRKETEFYAWIFGATMLTLGSLTTMTSCFIFCFCGDKWRRRRRSYRYNKDCSYQRVDSVSSVVDSSTDHVTII